LQFVFAKIARLCRIVQLCANFEMQFRELQTFFLSPNENKNSAHFDISFLKLIFVLSIFN
jgi:hypothetical protein